MKEKIGKVILNYDYYSGEDLYSEGDEAEENILDIVKKTDDYYDEILKKRNWIIIYHLLKQRENIVDPMEISADDEILEIGAGMGAITGALARKAKKVDCIDLSKRRSMINAYRNKKYNNIEIFVGNFEDIKIDKKYDVVVLIGVLEYAQHYIASNAPYDDFIKKISQCLKSNGKLYLAIENKLGLKYFAGYCEDHLGKPFVGIEEYKKEDNVKTFSKSQLENLILRNGFKSTYFYYPYPDYKLPEIIFSDDYLPTNEFNLSIDSNYAIGRIRCFDENKVYKSLSGTEELKMLSNSFLVEAIRS
ncbi:class I SAM-dependent methyltransferase [Clostridium cagae]|uniref:class I SAM-dependent methyltransferase n=1 Tax=Clostridium cagae TaxID=2080751 RepID=UPI000CF68560|nr:class I SAM-dependent methyltransferase [Clostridium cagae]